MHNDRLRSDFDVKGDSVSSLVNVGCFDSLTQRTDSGIRGGGDYEGQWFFRLALIQPDLGRVEGHTKNAVQATITVQVAQ